MNRQEILEEAAKAVTTERQSAYGTPENSFSGIADYWNVYMAQRAEGPFTAHDVGMMLLLMKVRRTVVSPGKADNYVDLAGYGACVGEISTGEVQAELSFEAQMQRARADSEVAKDVFLSREGRITGNPVHDALLKQMGGLVEAPSDAFQECMSRVLDKQCDDTIAAADALLKQTEAPPDVIAEAAQWAADQAAPPQGNYTDEEWAKEIRAQKAFEDHGLGQASEWVMFGDKPEQAYARFLADPYPIPAPPSGREWHNPRELNAFQIGVADGWRLCLKDEQSHECEAYVGGHLMWESRTFSGGAVYGDLLGTYRTKAPIVSAEPKTPDIPPRQTFPDPPAGRKWHNPEGLTPEQVGVADGWRLCLEDEACSQPHEWCDTTDGQWGSGTIAPDMTFRNMPYTYRTKAPLP